MLKNKVNTNLHSLFPGCCIEIVLVDENKVKYKDINAGVWKYDDKHWM